jgi:hypothetical protein
MPKSSRFNNSFSKGPSSKFIPKDGRILKSSGGRIESNELGPESHSNDDVALGKNKFFG